MWTLLLACRQPLLLPEDPSERGVTVGVRTLELDGHTAEVWYPAHDGDTDMAEDETDYLQYVPDEVLERTGEPDVPTASFGALRDARVRPLPAPVPLLLFSHGLSAFRSQSQDLTVHLASRGYVVVSLDHEGRRLADLLPCVFSPPLESCSLATPGTDPAVRQLQDALDAIAKGGLGTDLSRITDDSRVGVLGHSAGGFTTGTLALEDERIDAAFPMAASVGLPEDMPGAVVSGTCDGVVLHEDTVDAWTAMPGAPLVTLEGVGHLPFSDLCDIDLPGLAEELFGDRKDVNAVFYDLLVSLASDGCPGSQPTVKGCEAFAPVDETQQLLRLMSTQVFDAALKSVGAGLDADGIDVQEK